jgi:hypothetical protein
MTDLDQFPTWLSIWYLALAAEDRGDFSTAEYLERRAMIQAFNTGWADSLLPEDFLTPTRLMDRK